MVSVLFSICARLLFFISDEHKTLLVQLRLVLWTEAGALKQYRYGQM